MSARDAAILAAAKRLLAVLDAELDGPALRRMRGDEGSAYRELSAAVHAAERYRCSCIEDAAWRLAVEHQRHALAGVLQLDAVKSQERLLDALAVLEARAVEHHPEASIVAGEELERDWEELGGRRA